MKKFLYLVSFLFALGFILAHKNLVYAQEKLSSDGNGHTASLTETLGNILTSQNVSTLAELNCEKVADREWEELGEAVMSQMHPGPDQHAAMDVMMGGEGSESLRVAHVQMGQSYLGCKLAGMNATGLMGMGGMMGMGNMMGGSMMNQESVNWGWSGLWSGLMFVFWLAALAVLISLARLFWLKANR